MYIIRKLEDTNRIPRLPVYMDSPMAISVTDLYLRHHEDHDLTFSAEEEERKSAGRPHRALHAHGRGLKKDQRRQDAGHHHFGQRHGHRRTRAASHCARWRRTAETPSCWPDFRPKARADALWKKARKRVRIHGEDVPVAAEVINLRQFSAHAGKSELMRWLSGHSRASAANISGARRTRSLRGAESEDRIDPQMASGAAPISPDRGFERLDSVLQVACTSNAHFFQAHLVAHVWWRRHLAGGFAPRNES